MKTSTLSLIALLAAAGAGIALAQTGSREPAKDHKPAERDARALAHGKRWVASRDRNADGLVSPDEFAGALFERLDRNGDGFLDAGEAPRQRPGPPPRREEDGERRPPPRDDGGERRPPRHEGGGGPSPEGFVTRLDLDGDGKVSAEEFDGPADHFAELDQDGDGFVALDEAPSGPPPRRPPPPRRDG